MRISLEHKPVIRGNVMAFEVNTDLIRRAQQGDEAVITWLYEKYHTSIYRYLYYRVESREAAEDLTSDVFLRMLRFISNFHPPHSSFQSWLFQIARNLAIDHHRLMKVRDHLPLEENLVSGSERTDLAAERSQTNESLRVALKKLSEDQRDVILMRFISGMPIAEVASALHKSEDSVKGLQRRGLAVLREILAGWEIIDE